MAMHYVSYLKARHNIIYSRTNLTISNFKFDSFSALSICKQNEKIKMWIFLSSGEKSNW